MEKGYLVIQTTTTDMIFPVSDTGINVKNGDKEYNILTDRSGKTETIEIDTPDMINSTQQTNEPSFTTLEVTVTKDGYYTIKVKDVQVFPRETSLLYVNMIPLPENESDKTIEYSSNPQNL